jgi:MFS family permease
LRMAESPLFTRIKQAGTVSTNPLRDSFARRSNLKLVLLALFGAVMGQGVVWYTGQFYAQTFIERTCGVEFEQTRYILCGAILLATPFFLVFGAWSDRIGRKTIMLAGMLLAILTYRPIYRAMYHLADPKAKQEIAGQTVSTTSVEVRDNGDLLRTVWVVSHYTDGTTLQTVEKKLVPEDSTLPPPKPDLSRTLWLPSPAFWAMMGLVFVQILYVTMVYGPIAAFLVELFPTRIRYTSMSLPYHIGNGIFGGLTPFIATRLTDASKTAGNPAGDPLVGLWYPIAIAAVCFVIGLVYLPSRQTPLDEEA